MVRAEDARVFAPWWLSTVYRDARSFGYVADSDGWLKLDVKRFAVISGVCDAKPEAFPLPSEAKRIESILSFFKDRPPLGWEVRPFDGARSPNGTTRDETTVYVRPRSRGGGSPAPSAAALPEV